MGDQAASAATSTSTRAHRRTRRWVAAVALAASSAGLVTASEGVPRAGAITTSDVAKTYAPIVYLHPSETHWPMMLSNFIRLASLKFSRTSTLGYPDATIASEGNVDASRLSATSGASAYSYKWRNHTWYSSSYTRPRGGDGYSKSPLKDVEGMYLDLEDSTSARAGVPDTQPSSTDSYEGAPSYYQVIRFTDGTFAIAYWFFYAYNNYCVSILCQNHEGDWEHIVEHFSSNSEPLSVTYSQHEGCYVSYRWANAPRYRSGTHPVVFSALGSHASYPSSGDHQICKLSGVAFDHTSSSGKRWFTWGNLVDLSGRPGYGFGGAWGEVGNFEFTTGPSGPPWKSALPDVWAA